MIHYIENGLDLMKKFLEFEPNAIIIIMTAYSTIENSIKAIKSGAYYFITKPIDSDQLMILLNTANEKLYSTIENSIKAIKSGAYYFITKPIDSEQLMIVLNTANEKLKMVQKINNLEGHIKKEVETGNFREDLYYRINVINIVAPPLRERIEDLKHLVPYFIDKYNISFNKDVKGITDEAYEILSHYSFKGNVRELENIIQRAVLLNTSEYIEADLLHMSPQMNSQKTINSSNNSTKNYIKIYEGENMKEIEKKVIEFALKGNNQNRKWTAESLGIGERTLRYKIKEYDL